MYCLVFYSLSGNQGKPMPKKLVRLNVIYNLLGSIIPIAVVIFTIPAYLRVIGEVRYGLISLVWITFGYFGIFDLGLSRALAYQLSSLRSRDIHFRAQIFYTACSLSFGLGCIAALSFYFVANALAGHFTTDPALRAEVARSLPWLAAFFPAALLGGTFAGCLQAEEKFLELNVQQSIGSVLFQCLPLILIYCFARNLELAIAGAVIARVVSVVWMGLSCLKWARAAGAPSIDMRHARRLFSYGGWVTISDIFAPILSGLDQLIIGSILGAQANAYYSVPFSMAQKALIFPNALCRAVFPRLSEACADDARRITKQLITATAGLMALMCAPAIMLTHLGLQIWINDEFARAAYATASILLVGIWFNSLAYLPFTFLQARGHPDVIAKIHMLEVLPFVAVLFLFVKVVGLEGAAIAWSTRMIADVMLQSWRGRLYWDDYKPAVPFGSAVLVALAISLLDLTPTITLCWTAGITSFIALWMVLFCDVAQYIDVRSWKARVGVQ